MRWIPCSERMPTEADADEYGCVVWRYSGGSVEGADWNRSPSPGRPHWMPVPPLAPEPSGPTVEVRVAVHVNIAGYWQAYGQHGRVDAALRRRLDEPEHGLGRFWLTAILPIPQPAEPVTVAAEVETP
jgi:hypothetical protein